MIVLGITENMEILRPVNNETLDDSAICIAILDQDSKEDMINHLLDMMIKNPQWNKEYEALLNIVAEDNEFHIKKIRENDNNRDEGLP